ncbi:MAG: hypothetical protein OXE77_04425 [Flavobacteriaceae bacterium]|nr:hypothetical protein [Flavobacteriaceae bacterium]MCY4268115.1 hypothetical protein [Flavobacteriaceae bacterium]
MRHIIGKSKDFYLGEEVCAKVFFGMMVFQDSIQVVLLNEKNWIKHRRVKLLKTLSNETPKRIKIFLVALMKYPMKRMVELNILLPMGMLHPML